MTFQVAALLLASLVFASPSAAEQRAKALSASRMRAPEQRIVNGLTTVEFPTTVALLDGGGATGDGEVFCTGTLIGCQTVLTAAHCVCGGSAGVDGALCQPGGAKLTSASAVRVFAQSGGVHQVTSIDVPEHFEFGEAGDVALLHLASAVNGIPPTPINTQATPADGAVGWIVGFGRTGGFASDVGVKRWGKVAVAPCSTVPEESHVCWDFEEPLGPPGEDSNTCNGDSGGPLLADLGAGLMVAGVTSGGENSLCTPPDDSYDSDVFVEREWIQEKGGADLDSTSCGPLGQVGTPEVGLHFGEGVLSSSNPEELWLVEVPAGTEHLRVTLNGVNGRDFDLYVRQGAPPTDSEFDCRPYRVGQIEVCDLPAPIAGDWYVRVKRFSGSSARYQTTLTLFGESTKIFGNGFESGTTGAWSKTVP